MSELKGLLQREVLELDFIDSDFRLVQFNGGTINSSYRLETQGKRYFVKTFESNQIAQLDRTKLFDIQKELARVGLSVKPVYLSKSGCFQIDEWLDAPTLDTPDLSDLQVSKSLASTLSIIHSTQINVPPLDLPAQWQYYANLLTSGLNDEDLRKIEPYARIWQDACAKRAVFCHNDLALSHITDSSPSIVFDWEYCALSCPYFDIASCIAVNGLSHTNQASLCALYAQHQKLPLSEVLDNVAKMKPLVELTYKLWYQSAKQAA